MLFMNINKVMNNAKKVNTFYACKIKFLTKSSGLEKTQKRKKSLFSAFAIFPKSGGFGPTGQVDCPNLAKSGFRQFAKKSEKNVENVNFRV